MAAQADTSVHYYKSQDWFTDEHNGWTVQEEKITGINAAITDTRLQRQIWATENDGPHKILVMGNTEKITELEANLKNRLGTRLNIYKFKPTYLEITNPLASKTAAMRFLLKRYNLAAKDVLAIGDNYNDREMLGLAGTGVAMGNAPDEVKACAGFVTMDNDSDGVKYALDKFIP